MERERKMGKYRTELAWDSPAAPATCADGEPRAPVGRPRPTGTGKVTIIMVIITVKRSRKRLRPPGRAERVKDEPRRRSSAGPGQGRSPSRGPSRRRGTLRTSLPVRRGGEFPPDALEGKEGAVWLGAGGVSLRQAPRPEAGAGAGPSCSPASPRSRLSGRPRLASPPCLPASLPAPAAHLPPAPAPRARRRPLRPAPAAASGAAAPVTAPVWRGSSHHVTFSPSNAYRRVQGPPRKEAVAAGLGSGRAGERLCGGQGAPAGAAGAAARFAARAAAARPLRPAPCPLGRRPGCGSAAVGLYQ